jgi:hypothetical protein
MLAIAAHPLLLPLVSRPSLSRHCDPFRHYERVTTRPTSAGARKATNVFGNLFRFEKPCPPPSAGLPVPAIYSRDALFLSQRNLAAATRYVPRSSSGLLVPSSQAAVSAAKTCIDLARHRYPGSEAPYGSRKSQLSRLKRRLRQGP